MLQIQRTGKRNSFKNRIHQETIVNNQETAKHLGTYDKEWRLEELNTDRIHQRQRKQKKITDLKILSEQTNEQV